MIKIHPAGAVLLIHGSMLIAVPALLLAAGPAWVAGLAWSGFRWIGLLVTAGGFALYVRTSKKLTPPGRGTAAVWDPPAFLVRESIYRVVRNPMYAAVILIAAGEAMVFDRALLAVNATALWLGFHLFVTLYEEPGLVRRFGAPYENYCRTVPRWLPRF